MMRRNLAGYGFQTDTPDFANCLQRESLARLYATPPAPYWGYWGQFWGPLWRGNLDRKRATISMGI
jgi:hypothetical protein